MHGGNMKRQRGRGRRPGGGGGHQHNGNPNRTMESTGPDTKVRGPASHIHERYLQLARDAASSGDRVLSENYLQHADHYFRLVRQMQPAAPPPQPDRFTGDPEFDGEEERAPVEAEAAEGAEAAPADGDEQPDAEFPQQQFDRGEGRRRRGRRSRFRPDGEREAREGGEAREDGDEQRAERRERSEESREPRRERPPREEREPAGPEGFSSGPKPAFLRSGD